MKRRKRAFNLSIRAWLTLASLALLLWSAGRTAAATVTVNMTNFTFSPRDVSVNAGDTVTWMNRDFTSHDTTSGTNRIASGLWGSPLIGHGGTFSFTFNVPAGYYGYYCTPHFPLGMVGSVTVLAPNAPPSVVITNPPDGSTFVAGADVTVQASASDSDGLVTRVDFFANGNPIGSASTVPFTATLSQAAAGTYSLTAIAVDNLGAGAASPAVNITVSMANVAPSVAITNPVSGQSFFAGSDVLIEASASDPDGSVSQVQFFTNGVSAGIAASPPYSLVLSNITIGDYTLSAVATDNLGASSASLLVGISVLTPTERPTILTPPRDQTVTVGSNVTFSVSAAGTAPLVYQWRFNGSDVADATATALTLTRVQFSNSGPYTVLVSNSAGSVTSSPALLTVQPPPNIPPTVAITNPVSGTSLPANASLTIAADVRDTDGTVVQVEFLVGTNSFVVTQSPFRITLSNLPPGGYVLTAKATDDRGGAATSAPVLISVGSAFSITLLHSPNGANLPLGTNILLSISNSSAATPITNVEYFAGITSLGRATNPPFTLIWRPSEVGLFSLQAIAIDDLGQSATSAPVAIYILDDRTRPHITITRSPPNFSRPANPLIEMSGTASDDQGLDLVEFQINDGPFQAATGATLWSARITLPPGHDTVRVRSVDLVGNVSAEAALFFTYIVTAKLSLKVIQGSGIVFPDLDGRSLEIGKVYAITARPGSGEIFAGWQVLGNTNDALPKSTNDAALSFVMQPGLQIAASFVPNPFPAVGGVYTGIFTNQSGLESVGLALDTNQIALGTSGYFSLKVGKPGSFTGKLMMNGSSYPFRGRFDHLGQTKFPVLRRTLLPVVLAFRLDLTNGTGQILGTVTIAEGSSTFIANLLAERNVPLSRTHPQIQAGQRAFLLRSVAGAETGEVGNGSAQISAAGGVRMHGSLIDGRKFALSSSLSVAGNFPFYLSLGRGTEVMVGWLRFANDPADSVSGDLLWVEHGTNRFSLLDVAPGGQ